MGVPLNQVYDSSLCREVAEFMTREGVYRCVAELGGRYRLQGLLSVGGYGVIYEAADTWLFDKKVLIKANRYSRRHLGIPNNRAVVREVEEQRDRMDHERRMLLQAQRRRIPQVPILLDVITDLGLDLYGPHEANDGTRHHYTLDDLWRQETFLVLSFINGKPLNDWMKDKRDDRYRQSPLRYARQIIFDIGRILQGFHEEQPHPEDHARFSFIYQDLKPQNIVFTREKQFALIDFGGFAVRIDGRTETDFARTGTPGYQPPEFIDANFPTEWIDARADVFCLGATVYHVATGEAPASDHRGRALFNEERLKQLPPAWGVWMHRATHEDPKQRFPDMGAAIEGAKGLPSNLSS